MRVPSGNMMTQVPCESSRQPCSMTCFMASLRDSRSMWIMSSRAIDQPKNGTLSNSRLNTKASGCGIRVGSSRVSNADWCLDNNTAALLLPSGKWSYPSTLNSTPKIARVPHITTLNQLTAVHQAARRENRDTSSTASAQGITVITIQAMCKIDRISASMVSGPRLFAAEQKVNEGGQIVVHQGMRRKGLGQASALVNGALAGQHQMRL